MKRIFPRLSYEKRTGVLLCASRFIRLVAIPCRILAGILYKAARCLERLPESLCSLTLFLMEPSKDK